MCQLTFLYLLPSTSRAYTTNISTCGGSIAPWCSLCTLLRECVHEID